MVRNAGRVRFYRFIRRQRLFERSAHQMGVLGERVVIFEDLFHSSHSGECERKTILAKRFEFLVSQESVRPAGAHP